MTKPSFEVKIITAIMLAVVLIVSATGFLAYDRLTSIATSLVEEARPDLKLVILKGILSDLSNAESHIKSYSLTKDDKHLEPYYYTISQIDDKIDALNEISDTTSRHTRAKIDSIGALIERKFMLWDEMLQVSQNDPLKKVLTQIKQRIEYKRQRSELEKRLDDLERQRNKKEEVNDEPEEKPVIEVMEEDEPVETEKSNIFKRLFGKKIEENKTTAQDSVASLNRQAAEQLENKESKAEADNDSSEVVNKRETPQKTSSSGKEDIQREIAIIEKKEGHIRLKTEARQLEIIEKDKVITQRIRQLISEMENEEMKRFEDRAIMVDRQAAKTNQMITAFCIATSVLLLFVFYLIIRYVRKTGAYQKALRKAKSQAENLAATKELFMANMSHEIRTPMNSILGFTEQAMKNTSSNEQKEQLKVVKSASEHLMRIINDILDFSKLEAVKLTIDETEFSPSELILETFNLLRVQAESKDLDFQCVIEPGVPEILIGDPVRLKQILVNLAGNAIKFTEKGTVKIGLSSKPLSNNRNELKVTVNDSGIGIHHSRLSSIFEDFMQAEMSTTRKYGGTGLGLAIAKRLVEQQGGQIVVKSTLNVGSDFTFTIPYKLGNNFGSFDAMVEKSPAENGFEKLSILLADDEEYNRLLLKTILKNWRVSFKEVVNGKEAVDALEKEPFDMVLMDVRMPVMDGLKATTYIREELKSDIPVIALTAATSKEDVNRCMDAGMNDFISKPFTEEELYKTLLKVKLATTKTEARVISTKSNGKLANKKTKDPEQLRFNIKNLSKLANGDDNFVAEMLRVFIQTTEEGIEQIREGMEQKDWKKVADQAHKIASPCRHMEAIQLLDYLKSIESIAETGKDPETIPQIVEKLEKESAEIIAEMKLNFLAE